jgi:hypothetical protein
MLTKTQAEIMKVFSSEIAENFTIKQISELLNKPYPLIHRSIQSLINGRFILKDKRNLLNLNYKENHSELAYIEALRKQEFLSKNKTIHLFSQDVLEKVDDFFVFLVFGSSIKNDNPRDVDILLIFEDEKKAENYEKIISNLASDFSLKFDINSVSIQSAYEMFTKREKANVMNETLNNHIILFGAENFYNLLKNAR